RNARRPCATEERGEMADHEDARSPADPADPAEPGEASTGRPAEAESAGAGAAAHGAIETLPLLPMRTGVLFPTLILPLSVGRPATVASVDAALATEEKQLAIVAQREATVEEPGRDDLF